MVNFNKSIYYYLLLFILFPITIPAQQLAFPTAEGFGRFTSGGRGGAVLKVTNISDSGPGSLREAIETEGPRTIIFLISGTIILESPLVIKENNLTLAGQTAPGDGVCVSGYPTIVNADNVIIRYMRFRLGDVNKIAEDAIMAIRQKEIIIDHCSMSWGMDEVATFYDNQKATVQWCIISESLNHSYHPKGDHGYGGIWGGMGVTFHHNLLAHHISRLPRFCGSRYHKQPEKELVDYRNNVVYNWGHNSSYGGESGKHNIIANYYKAGPASKHKNRIVEPWDEYGKWYIEDNIVFGFPLITNENWNGGVQGDFVADVKAESAFNTAPVNTQNAEEAYKLVLEKSGAVLPERDEVDQRIIRETQNGTATFGGFYGHQLGIIDSQDDVGGWPELKSTMPPKDSDNDGMPDSWEIENGLDINQNDVNLDQNKDGYTNIENYINSLSD